MAEIVGVYAASHTPVMLNFPDAIPAADREAIYAGFRDLGARISASRPDVVIIVSDDHLHNFFLDNLPAFCVGAAESYPTPVEHWLKAQKRVLRGDPGLSAHILGEALQADFDPSFSMNLTLDHGTLTPLELAGIAGDVAVVPIVVNCVQPPLPTMKRALIFGRMLGRVVASYPKDIRVAVLGTGGLSHDVGTPRMGMVNETFDREFLRLLGSNDDDGLLRYAEAHVDEAGNGAEEIRNWLVAHGAAGTRRFRELFYRPVGAWYTGIALGEWT